MAGMFFCTGGRARADLINAISVIVNDSVITYAQIQGEIAPEIQTMVGLYRGQPDLFEQQVARVRTNAIEGLVERKLILNEFKTAGYNLPETFIDDAIKDEIHKNYGGNRVRLTQTLQGNGMTFENFRQQQRERIIVDYMISQHVSVQKILISPRQIEAFYSGHQDQFKLADQVKVRVIVINQPVGGAPGSAKKITEEVLRKMDEGVPFAEMANVYSAGSRRQEGGDRGWVDRNGLVKELSDVAFSLKPGQRSGIIELGEVCYLCMVEDARIAHVKPLAEVRFDIEGTLKLQEEKRLQKKWIERLKSKAFVRYY